MKRLMCLANLYLPALMFAAMSIQPAEAAGAPAGASYNVKDYGAVGDGKALETAAINQTIRACNQAGGGTVLFPAGTYVTGTFELLSHVTLSVQAGAVIKGSKDLADYGVKTHYGIKGLSGQSGEGLRAGLIIANNAENIAILGPGTIDGQGTYFVDVNKPHNGEPPDYDKRLTRQGDDFMSPKFGTADGPVRPWMPWSDRPGAMIILADCKNVLVRDVTLKDSHNWTVNITESEDVVVSGINVSNNLLIPNNDGINITAKNARISDCHISAGDDAIAANDCDQLVVSNCVLRSRSSAIRFCGGHACSFQNLVIYDSNRGIGIYGSAHDVSFSDVLIQTRLHTGHWWGKSEPIHISTSLRRDAAPEAPIQNIRFSNIVADCESGILVYGTESQSIRDLSFDRIKLRIRGGAKSDAVGGNFDLRGIGGGPELAIFAHPIPGLYGQYVDGLKIRGFELEWTDPVPSYFSDGIYVEHFTNLVIDDFTGRQAQPAGTGAAISLHHGATVTIRDCAAAPGTGTFVLLDEVRDQRLFAQNDLANARQATEPAHTEFTMTGNDIPKKE